jgi:hypothetical protein
MAYPYIVLDGCDLRFSSWGVPYRLSDYIETVIIAPNKRNIRSNQDMISNFNVALNVAVRPKLNAVAKFDDLIRRPNADAPWDPD